VEEPPGELLAELALLSESAGNRPLPSENRFAIPFLIRWLVNRSHAYRYRDPEKVLELALLARLAADACSTEAAGNSARLADLRCRAWGQLGNALRICARLSEANEMLSKAQEYCGAGTGAPLLRGLLFEWIAPLHYFERRLGEALQITLEAEAIYEEQEETQLLARARIKRSILDIESGDPERATLLLGRTIPLINGEEDPYLLLAARHNMVRCYIDLGQPHQALDRFLAAKPLTSIFHEPLLLSRIAWQEGELFRKLGNLEFAETAFLRAREGFVKLGLTYEVALVANQLATVYLEMGADDKLEHSVSQTLSYCRARTICRETKNSLDDLQRLVFR
jgi:tetratricopeptide (TPR) repeat protein